jgi:hypothetical protein
VIQVVKENIWYIMMNFIIHKWYDIDKCIEIKNSDSESPRELLNKFIILYLASCVYLLRVSHPKKDAFWR